MPEHALTTPIGEPLEQSRKENNLMSTMLPLAVARQHKVPTTEGADIFLGNFMLSSNIVAHSGLFFFCLRLYGFAFILKKEKSGVKSFQRNLLTTLRLQAVCRSMKPMNFADGGCHPTRPEMRFFFTPQMCWYFQMLSARKPVGCLLLFCRRLILIKIQRWDGKI